MTFYDFIISQAGRGDDVGDLGEEIAGDPDFPRALNDPILLGGYLMEHVYTAEQLAAATAAWQEYQLTTATSLTSNDAIEAAPCPEPPRVR
ncbi:uncharacterized protein YozE (UPF0346 family) [Kushneria sinocarnis]|uniref:Uncharacterized protein YozE (UPF0346 family) n=1 Tax=Kushneria sinocarnis TaxID=595502 RepID=A0A420WSI4_9GAMM|nr:YozE family protein [Kushneria sinocarnis]RKQ95726.1 uncharacterized protein YozE (UPF0346 family) [Kushneria sinocarnis]